MKRYSSVSVIQKMRIKTIMRYHHTPILMAETKKHDLTKHRQGYRRTKVLIYFKWECKMIQLLWHFPSKLKIYMCHMDVHTKTCIRMVIIALFVKPKTWKQPKHPLTGEGINISMWITIQKFLKNKLLIHKLISK